MSITFMPTGGNGGMAVPYARTAQTQHIPTMAAKPQDAIRLRRYEEHWRFYQGLHWSITREEGVPLVTANYCRAIVDKKASWLVGKGVAINVPQALQEITKPVLAEVWEYNNEKKLLLDMATMGGVTGDCCILVTYVEPNNVQKRINPYTQGRIRIRLLGSHQVFPTWNPLNTEDLLSVRVITEVDDSGIPSRDGVGGGREQAANIGQYKKKKFVEDIFPDRIVEGWEGDIPTIRPNSLGEIPFIHISNQSFPCEFWGLSDLDGVIDIQREYNEKLTDVSDIVNYHAAPVTVITGAKARSLEKGPKSLWSGLPTDAKVFNLELGGDLAMSHKYLETVRQIMMDLAGLPEGSLGRIQSISNTSAAALEVQFQPLIEATQRKRPNYERGIEQINYFILRYYQLVKNQMFPVDLCRHCGGRIVEFIITDSKGKETRKKKCYLIDPQTLEFMKPDDVKVKVKRQYSFGVETREMPYGRVKAEYGKKSASYWDPDDMVDLQDEANKAKAEQEAQVEEANEQLEGQAEAEHSREMELVEAKKPPPKAE